MTSCFAAFAAAAAAATTVHEATEAVSAVAAAVGVVASGVYFGWAALVPPAAVAAPAGAATAAASGDGAYPVWPGKTVLSFGFNPHFGNSKATVVSSK
mgnify:CR=1 FL=1